jgi:hypothetical protein
MQATVAGLLQVLLAPEADANLLDPIFCTVAADPGLEQAVPYLVAHIAAEVKASMHSLMKLSRLLQAAFAIVLNRTNNLGAYLPQLLPALMTCLLSAKLGPPRALYFPLSCLACKACHCKLQS